MSESTIAALIIGSLGIVAWFLIRDWKKTWEDRVIAHDERLDIHSIKHSEQDVINATLTSNIEHIKETGDTTAADVKELLKLNGHRASSR